MKCQNCENVQVFSAERGVILEENRIQIMWKRAMSLKGLLKAFCSML